MTIFGINNELYVYFFSFPPLRFKHRFKKYSVSVRGFVTFKINCVHNCKLTFPLGKIHYPLSIYTMLLKFPFNGFYSVILYERKTRFLILETEITQSIFNFFSGYRIQYPYQYARLTVLGIERLCHKTCSD